MSTEKKGQKQIPQTTATKAVKPEEKAKETVNQVQPTTEENPKEVEELKKQIEELKNKLVNSPQTLEERIKYLQVKQQLVKKLNLLKVYEVSINEYIQIINEEVENDILLTENFNVEFNAKNAGSYSAKEVLKIQNPAIIIELFKFASDKISEQIIATEIQINA